jgi:hypothetical protein
VRCSIERLRRQNLKTQSKLIQAVLKPALGLWLRSQTDAVDHLVVEIAGGDRQLLSGQIPTLTIEASEVVYQGLRLGQLRLVGHKIQMNLGQALRGKPLRLLESVQVDADLRMGSEDLNGSLVAPLLAPALADWLAALALWLRATPFDPSERHPFALDPSGEAEPALIKSPQIQFAAQTLVLRAQWCEGDQSPQNLAIAAQVHCRASSLQLTQPRWLEPPPAGLCADLASRTLPNFELGRDVAIEALVIEPDGLSCQGVLTIHP